jgi:Concanavalin A-like lectin/glucanases superfamily
MKITAWMLCLGMVTGFIALSSCKKNPPALPADTVGEHINDSVWAYYPIKGGVADASGHNHALNLLSGASLTFDEWGTDNEALNFDGASNYALIPDGAAFPSSNFSLALLVMPRENRGLFLGKQDYATGKAASFNVGIDNPSYGNTPRFSITSNQAQVCSQFATSGIVCLNSRAFYPYAWYYVVCTFNNGTMKFYVNGQLVSTQTTPFQAINSCSNGQFVLGDWWSGGHNLYNGKMDEIRIYTRALSADEVTYLYNQL